MVAAAVTAGADVIVTANLEDFPAPRLPLTMQVLAAPDFARTIVSADPPRCLQAVREIAARSGRVGDNWSPHGVLDRLAARYAMDDAVDLLRQVLHSSSR